MKLIRTARSQSIRLPKEFHFAGKEVLIKRMGIAVVLLPKGESWASHLRSIPGVSADFMKDRVQAKSQVRASAK